MYSNFQEMPADARIWIYQASRSLDAQELSLATQVLQKFAEGWAAHGVPLLGSFAFAHSRFLIMAVDEKHHAPSGCSIDASVGAVRELERALDVSFLDRTLIPFKQGNEIVSYPMSALKKLIQEGKIAPEAITFNNMIERKADLAQAWEVPAKESWMKRYFTQSVG